MTNWRISIYIFLRPIGENRRENTPWSIDEFSIFSLQPIEEFCDFFPTINWQISGFFLRQIAKIHSILKWLIEEFGDFFSNDRLTKFAILFDDWIMSFTTFSPQLIDKSCDIFLLPIGRFYSFFLRLIVKNRRFLTLDQPFRNFSLQPTREFSHSCLWTIDKFRDFFLLQIAKIHTILERPFE